MSCKGQPVLEVGRHLVKLPTEVPRGSQEAVFKRCPLGCRFREEEARGTKIGFRSGLHRDLATGLHCLCSSLPFFKKSS